MPAPHLHGRYRIKLNAITPVRTPLIIFAVNTCCIWRSIPVGLGQICCDEKAIMLLLLAVDSIGTLCTAQQV